MVQRWFDGGTLYRDVVDTNPPLIIWLTAPPVWIARITGWPAPALFKIYVCVIAAASLLTARAVARRAFPHREFVLITSLVFLCLPFVKMDFGQREHFALLLTVPYVLAAGAPDVTGRRWTGWSIGIAGGLGFAIKPHFLAAWIAIEAVVIARDGIQMLRRPQVPGAIAVFIIYALVVTVAVPQYFPIADQVRRVYGGLDSSPAVLLRLREVQLWIVALAFFAAVRWPSIDRLTPIVFAAGTGYLLAALLQFKGWGYQLYPARVFILLFLVTAVAALLDDVPPLVARLRGGRRGLAVVFAGALVLASARYVLEARHPPAPDLVTPLRHAIAAHAPRGPIAVLSMRTIIYPAFPAVNYTGAAWSLRHNSLWFLPGLYADQDARAGGPLEPHPLDRMTDIERVFFDQIVDDLCTTPPLMLAVEQAAPSSPAGRRALDLLAYYRQSPRAARLLDNYHPADIIGPFTIYTAPSTSSCSAGP